MHHHHGNDAGLGSLPVWQAGVNQQPSCSKDPTRVQSQMIIKLQQCCSILAVIVVLSEPPFQPIEAKSSPWSPGQPAVTERLHSSESN